MTTILERISQWFMEHLFAQDAVAHEHLVCYTGRPTWLAGPVDPDLSYIISDGPTNFLSLVPSQYTKITQADLEWERVIHTTDVQDWSHGILIGILGCARCGQDHPDDHPLAFLPFDRPVMDDDGVWSHWAICPNTGDPVLLRNPNKKGQ